VEGLAAGFRSVFLGSLRADEAWNGRNEDYPRLLLGSAARRLSRWEGCLRFLQTSLPRRWRAEGWGRGNRMNAAGGPSKKKRMQGLAPSEVRI